MRKSNTGKSFRAAYLINGYLQKKLTAQEQDELESWLNHSDQNRQLFEELCSAEKMETEVQQYKNADVEAGWQWLQQQMVNVQSNRQRKIIWKTVWRSVAAVLVISVVTWQVLRQKAVKPGETAITSQYGGDVLPGTQRAELILSNGSTVMLNNSTDSVFTENGSAVQRTAGGSLVYTGGSSKNETAWNMLHIPRGGEYMIVLEDGSKVWLNAATRFRYPVQFTGKERRVELLEGEAFFEVAKNKEKPFIVVANRMKIQAVGTAFDVNTYPEADSSVTATLAEGKVKVSTGSNNHLLLPGEQVWVNESTAKILAADVEAVTAWKNGLFVFNGAPLTEVMQQVSRWYDVQIAYDKKFNEQKFFTGEIKRSVPVSKLLQMMELTGIARFRINERAILIQRYNEKGITTSD